MRRGNVRPLSGTDLPFDAIHDELVANEMMDERQMRATWLREQRYNRDLDAFFSAEASTSMTALARCHEKLAALRPDLTAEQRGDLMDWLWDEIGHCSRMGGVKPWREWVQRLIANYEAK